jgi:transitional endoplasmic reticulum ATPase
LDKKINLNKLALKTEGLTGSDIEFICRKAAMLAIRRLINKNQTLAIEQTGKISISENHFMEAIQLVLNQNKIKK